VIWDSMWEGLESLKKLKVDVRSHFMSSDTWDMIELRDYKERDLDWDSINMKIIYIGVI
jgi:hypothetical protein